MEELEIEDITKKAKKFRMENFKPLGFFDKLFNICYSNYDVNRLLDKVIILKELAEDKIKIIKHELFHANNKIENLNEEKLANENKIKIMVLSIENLEKDLTLQKEKHVKEIGKLSKTIQDLTYCKFNLEEEIKGLRTDLNECNRKHEMKTVNNNKDNAQFLDKILKRNQKLTDELKDIKEFLKKKKITFERL